VALNQLAFGERGLWVDLPSPATIVAPQHRPAARDAAATVRAALRSPIAGPPLRQRVERGQTVAISACDITRPQPRELMNSAVLEELDGVIGLDDEVILVATGTHRANTPEELRAMFGDRLVAEVRIANHDSRERSAETWMSAVLAYLRS
jgi:nickel-dependent lactate racemase